MAARHIAAGWVGLFMVLACGGSSRSAYQPSSALFERGEAAGWYIADRGSFYPLYGELDRHGLPDDDAPTLIEGRPPIEDSHYFVSLTVSPDGAYLAGLTTPFGGPIDETHLVVFDTKLGVVYEDPALSHKTQHKHVRWSPDGQFIAFSHGSSLSVLDWETKEKRIVASDAKAPRPNRVVSAMSWSPDSTRLAYETDDEHIAVRTLEGEQTARWRGVRPAWDPTGERIVHGFLGDRKDRRRVALFDLETEQSHDLFSFLVADQVFWTPDGRFLLFRTAEGHSSTAELHFYDVEAEQVFTTGKKLASTRHAQVFPLPAGLRDRLSLFVNNDTENPNRRSAKGASQ